MFGLFRTRPLLDEEVVRWQLECFAWLLANSGGFALMRETPLVTPTDEFFAQRGLAGHELASAIFEQVKDLAGLAQWPCQLEVQDDDPDPAVGELALVQGAPNSAAGRFRVEGESVVISYNPSGLRHPESLVATFAHELGHYFTAGFPEPPPGGWENWEFATDVASTFLGFGIFAANSCFNFRQFSGAGTQGWTTNGAGYLSEADHACALAIFLRLVGRPTADAARHLKPSLRAMLAKADRQLADYAAQIASLKQVQAAPAQGG